MRQRPLVILTLCLTFILAAFRPGQPQTAAAAPKPQARIQYAPDRDYDLLKITLDLKTDYAKLTLSGTAVNRLAPLRDGLTAIVLDCGRNISVVDCALDGRPAAFTHAGDKLSINAPGPL